MTWIVDASGWCAPAAESIVSTAMMLPPSTTAAQQLCYTWKGRYGFEEKRKPSALRQSESPASPPGATATSMFHDANDNAVLLLEVRDKSIHITDVAGVVDDEQEVPVLPAVSEDVVVDLAGEGLFAPGI